MSADNWTYCPKCQGGSTETPSAREKALKEAQEQYGKVPLEQYNHLMQVARGLSDDSPPEILREDFHQGMDASGEYSVSYFCSCDVCGWSWKYNYKVQALPKTP